MTNPNTGISAQGESTRSTEFKATRGEIVTSVNAWLVELAKKQSGGEALADGRVLEKTPRITDTDMGESGHGRRTIVSESVEGISLTGDGESSPLALQKVEKLDGEITEVRGTDPLTEKLYGNDYDISHQSDVVVSYGVRDAGDGDGRYFKYTIYGDGKVEQSHLDDNGVNSSRTLNTLEDLRFAQDALTQIQGSIA